MTIEEYNAATLASDFPSCEECGKTQAIATMIERDGLLFCSEQCEARYFAPLIKPQPKSAQCSGWDI